jgi:transposase-like protein
MRINFTDLIVADQSHSVQGRVHFINASGSIVNLVSDVFSSHLVCETRGRSPRSINRDQHHHFPAEMISHGVWVSFRFCLSNRDVDERLLARRVIAACEVIRP